ncbi:hypothetical protein [Endozoicomonas sp. 8E]|uniref:hypothetical protein n=1 Tax=Endozoicomonas sp. 8E TaxID=3035692 RepID=UPI0029390C6E|nr:hypothetical protein [Endozoicomonas sp. 8E]WOG26231.1 hypothetical protein P6910_16895 [Endozoicomonas sp. 8E]
MSYGPTPTTTNPVSSGTRTSQSSQCCASGSYADAIKKRLSTSNREIKSLTQPTQLPTVVHQRSTSPANISGRQASACQPATTSQPSRYCASGSYADAARKRPSASSQETKSLTQPAQIPQGVHQHSNWPSDISGRQISAHQESASTRQSSQYCASGSYANAAKKPLSTSNREAKPLAPQAQLPRDDRRHSNKSSNISGQQASAYQRSTPRTFHPEAKSPSPEAIKKEINSAFAILNNQNFIDAEKAFQVILQKYQGKLSLFNKENATIGLAKSLKEQTYEKKLKARSLLEELRLDGRLNKFGASVIHNLDLTLSLCEQALGWYFAAERRLLRLRQKRIDDNEKAQCTPSGFYAVDIANARLWQCMGKNTQSETLLVKIKEVLIAELESKPDAPSAGKLRKHLDRVNISLARLWQLMEKYQLAEGLLLELSSKQPDDSEDILCKPSCRDDINLALALLWQEMGKYNLSERLVLNMSEKDPDDSEEMICKPCGHHLVDLALARLWQTMGKSDQAETLLLDMSGKHPTDDEDSLCKPIGDDEIDLALVRLWETLGKQKLAERLLLSMCGKRLDDNEETLCTPFGNHEIDLPLARLWQATEKHERTERLLLNMSKKAPGDDEDSLCKPSGHHDTDLSLAFCWQLMGKLERAERLLKRCSDLYHSNEFASALLSLSAGQDGFMEMISRYPESADTLLVTSIHYFRLACEQIIDTGPKSGQENLHKALEFVESTLKKYPPTAGAFSQKAHCLRMLGKNVQQWRKWFNRADALDASRAYRAKTHFWRNREAAALQKLSNLKE